MAGGIGSRFWPESRNDHPKQFLDILGTGKSLIQWTYERFKNICPNENIFIITNEAYIPTLKEQLPGLPENNILSEPSRKNTAPCTVYITHKLKALNPNANIIMSPADHLIFDERKFDGDKQRLFRRTPPAHRGAVKSRADGNDGDVAEHFRGVEAIQRAVERVGLAAEERVEMSIGGRGDHI